MSMSLDNFDYWILPQIHVNYHLKYTATENGVEALVRLLKHVIEKKGLQHLLAEHEEL